MPLSPPTAEWMGHRGRRQPVARWSSYVKIHRFRTTVLDP